MQSGRCPKCASLNAEGAWICERCEWILDPSVLMPGDTSSRDVAVVGGTDGVAIDDDDDDQYAARTIPVVDAPDVAALLASQSPSADGTAGVDIDVADIMGGDAVILGKLADGDAESMLSDRTGSFLVNAGAPVSALPAPVYISNDLARLLQPAALPQRTHDASVRRGFLPPFEGLVFDFIDGRRSVLELRRETGMSENDMRVVLALLMEKAMIEVSPPQVEQAAHGSDVPAHATADAEGFDEHTRELDDLPQASAETPAAPVAEPAPTEPPVPGPPPASEVRYDELDMVPLPEPAPEPSPWARSVPNPPAPVDPDAFQLPRSDEVEAARPAMRFEPLRARPRNTPMPPSSPRRTVSASSSAEPEPHLAYKPKAGLTLSRAAAAPAPQSATSNAPQPSTDAKARAAQFCEMCMKDLREGRPGRAWGYAKMAADADPTDEKYRLLLADWGKMVGGVKPTPAAGGASPANAKDLFEESQRAEERGDYEAAVAHARKLCEVAPASAAAFNRLSVLLATRLKDFKAAYNAATTAVELDGSNMTYQSNMMKILAKLESGDDKPAGGAPRGGLVGKLLGR